ncbi:MAG: hypothetical protein DRN20_05070 [Thermoplasmata archaeon]|nr:MAG: hypothetical protein DRN20_05070 [Thermoplasmata archaeon]
MVVNRIKTYVEGLDEKISGGVPEHSVVLICGRAGTMKTSLCFSILNNNALNEQRKCLYLTLEQSRESVMEHMENMGIVPCKENVTILDLGKIKKEMLEGEEGIGYAGQQNWFRIVLSLLANYKKSFGCELFALDSLPALYTLTEIRNPRAELFYFFEKLREAKVTTFLISEMPADREIYGLYGVEDFLCDGIISIFPKRRENVTNLYLTVVKMRKTKHDRSMFPLICENGKFEIVINY